MKTGRPRTFDEEQLQLESEQLWQIFRAGVDAGYGPARMGGLVGWLVHREPPSTATLAAYRKILAELDAAGQLPTPPPANGRRRRARGQRGSGDLTLVSAGSMAGALAYAAASVSPGAAVAFGIVAAPIILEDGQLGSEGHTEHLSVARAEQIGHPSSEPVCAGRALRSFVTARPVHTELAA